MAFTTLAFSRSLVTNSLALLIVPDLPVAADILSETLHIPQHIQLQVDYSFFSFSCPA